MIAPGCLAMMLSLRLIDHLVLRLIAGGNDLLEIVLGKPHILADPAAGDRICAWFACTTN